MSTRQTAADNEAGWTDRYERLRHHALGGAAQAAECLLGLEVLLQHGVAVWMRAMPPSEAGSEKSESIPPPFAWLVADQEETTLVLAEMALSQFFNPIGGTKK